MPAPSNSPPTLSLPAPAKLNLFLHITGRRADSLHLLETVFQFIDLHDEIGLQLEADGRISRAHHPEGVSEEDDLTLRAARALRQAHPGPEGVRISLRKHIPIGAGLGGGSSDAATVLLGLNQLWQLGLSREQLIDIARPLGADVPIFVYGRNAYATGIGDQFEPITLPARWFVLLMPPVHVATGSIFSAPELTRDTKPITIQGFTGLAGRNDLQPIVEARQPAVRQALQVLNEAAERVAANATTSATCSNIVARMTGSGACVFAASDSLEAAHCLVEAIRQRSSVNSVIRHASDAGRITMRTEFGTLYVVKGLASHPLGSRQVG